MYYGLACYVRVQSIDSHELLVTVTLDVINGEERSGFTKPHARVPALKRAPDRVF